MFSRKDLAQLKTRGIPAKTAKEQLSQLEKGFPKMQLLKPATPGDGIQQLTEEELAEYQRFFESNINKLSLLKFVPASGAATRMFKTLYDFLNTYQDTEEDYLKFLSNKEQGTMFQFFEHIEEFPFYQDLKNTASESGSEIDKLLQKNQFKQVLALILTKKGLNYGNLPKGLLKFHHYKTRSRTSFEEHIVEALSYCKNSKGNAQLHLTVSEDHKKLFAKQLKICRKQHEEKHQGKVKVSFSVQKASTDTIAATLDNQPYRNEDGTILFRPGGHGALIENLNELKADIIFIKNIDNVVPDRLKEETIHYKKVLGGILLNYQEYIFEYLKILSKSKLIPSEKLNEMLRFTEENLCIQPPENMYYKSREEIVAYLQTILNRPIRVCGMVRNEGEPGGGPFWAKNPDGTISLQIVEGSQIDKEDKKQLQIQEQATHFNPVDLVCGIKDYRGKKFDLRQFIDPNTGFVSVKSQNGNKLKAMELPGLWNGAMSNWNTIFVEVPIITFNPVKTVFDLLRIEHRN
jgi:hypothetical protein